MSSFKSYDLRHSGKKANRSRPNMGARNTVDISDVEYELEAKGDRLSEFEDVNAVMSALSSFQKSNCDVMFFS